jgi:GAF domain-containing protein/anti-anti-sigma regulatory factor
MQASDRSDKSVSRPTLHKWLEVSRMATRQISATLDLGGLLPQVVRLLQESFDYYHVHVYLLDAERGYLDVVEGSGEPGRLMKEQGHRREVGIGLVGHVAATGRSALVPDVSRDERWVYNPLLPETKAELTVPLVLREPGKEEVLGVIDVQNDRVGSLAEDDLLLLESLSDQIAIAVRNARLFEQLERRNRELATLNAVSASLRQSLPLNELLTAALGQVLETMGCDAGLIALVDHRTGKLVLSTQQGLPDTLRERLEQDGGLEGTLCELVFEGTAEMGVEDLSQGAPVDVSGLVAVGLHFYLGTPLVVKGETTGALCIFDRRPRHVTEAEFDLMRLIGSQVAAATQSAWLLEETQRSLEKLQAAYETQDQLTQTVRELTTPVVQIWEDILVLPLVGHIDSVRATRIMEDLLGGIVRYQAEVVILDITGVPVVDTSVANYLLQTVKAAGMLGAKSILVGISGRIAQTLINIGIDLSEVETHSNLQAGIEHALSLVGQAISPQVEEA